MIDAPTRSFPARPWHARAGRRNAELARAEDAPLVGDFVGTGMHGGQILVRGAVKDWQLGREVGRVELTDACWFELRRNLEDFAREFGLEGNGFHREEFVRLMPVSHRPYGRIYVY